MTTLYAYSLLPVLSVALLLFFTAIRQARPVHGLAAYCLSVAVWSATLLVLSVPSSAAWLGERFAAVGAFSAAGYLHAAYDTTKQRRYELVWLAYAVALAITIGGAAWPGVIYGPRALAKGPLFWPVMGLAFVAAVVPLHHVARAYLAAEIDERRRLFALFLAGLVGDSGALGNALLLAHGRPLPFGMFLVLASLRVLAEVIRADEPQAERRLLERSLLYSALTAFLSAGFLFGLLTLMSPASEPLLAEYRIGALFLLFLALLAFDPLRQVLEEALGRRLIPGRAPASDVARALEREEVRAHQAERLAELGTFTSAVAHEVRNPLGVLSAHVKLLERQQSADAETLASMKEQIERATHFVEDLLRYGRPRPLELRTVDLAATLDLAVSTARRGLGHPSEGVEVTTRAATEAVEADQAQLLQALVILVDNALLAVEGRDGKVIEVSAELDGPCVVLAVDDSGPGIPAEVAPRLFQPFVTGRKREGPRPGTGLGLAIARSIAERHGGTIRALESRLGGARLEVRLPARRAPV